MGPRTVPIGSPTELARSHIARKARSVATVHTTVCRRRTGMPSVLARSARSALARTAVPASLRRSQSASAMKATGMRIIAMMSLPEKTVPLTSKLAEKGASSRVWAKASLPNAWGRNSAAPVSTWARPIVATVRMRRGARKKRRMMSISTTTPSTSAATTPMARARK